MAEGTEFIIGSKVACSDAVCGELKRVVIDPVAGALTHLAVGPSHGEGGGHLVPIDLIASVAQEIELRCTKAEFDALEGADETQFLPQQSGHLGYPSQHVYTLPFFGMGLRQMALEEEAADRGHVDRQQHTYDHVPVGEVEVRRGDHVDATDGAIGSVKGLVIDPSDHHVTHILLDEGHLWGEKTVAIPIAAVTRVGEIIRLSLSKDEVRDLPAVDLDLPK